MYFTRLRIDQFKCYEQTDLEFAEGTTVIHGINGSGKSSLLEACFFALYGAPSLPGGATLESVITKGATEAEVELWFTHAGLQYQLTRSVRETDSQVIHTAQLQTPAGVFEGVTAVEDEIVETLRMDADAFLNCAYVRQGDITRLLTASPADRQRMIDELLQLGKLETYRDRMDNARRGVDRVRRDRQSKLEDVIAEIETLEDEDLDGQLAAITERIEAIDAELDSLADHRAEVEAELEAAADELESLRDQQTELESITEALAEEREKRAAVAERYRELMQQLRETNDRLETAWERAGHATREIDIDVSVPASDCDDAAIDATREAVAEQRSELEATVETLDERIEDLQENAQTAASTHQRLLDRATSLEEQADAAVERAERREAEIDETQSQLEDLREDIEETEATIAEKKDRFAAEDVPAELSFGDADDYHEQVTDELAAITERETELEAELTAVQQRIEHAETLLDEGKCPECGQDVEGAPEVASLEADRETESELRETLEAVRDRRDSLEQDRSVAAALQTVEREVAQLTRDIEQRRTRADDLEETIEQRRAEATAAREEAAEKREAAADSRDEADQRETDRDEYLAELEAVRDEKAAVSERRSAIEELESALETIGRRREQLANRREQRDDVNSLLAEHDDRIEEYEAQQEALEEAIDDERIAALEATRDEATERLEALAEERADLESERESLTERRGGLQSKRERLGSLRDRRDRLRTKVEALENVVGECAGVQDMYGALRTELRRRNVTQLEQLLNDIFSLVYQNDSYARIELSDKYELTIHEKSGETLSPEELSGGEKALFNLSLRCAIYQLLAEGISGDAHLPPLILDEPTVHLDGEHINRIGDLVARMRQLGVEQTIVVSHEEEIVDGADERIEVIQNLSTNRSRVNVESTDLLAGLMD